MVLLRSRVEIFGGGGIERPIKFLTTARFDQKRMLVNGKVFNFLSSLSVPQYLAIAIFS